MKGGALWIALKSLRQHALSTWIASGSIALAGGLLMAVWALRSQAESTFTEANGGFDAATSRFATSIVLNSIFHLEASSGTIPMSTATLLQRNPIVRSAIARAIPIAGGDNYKGYRIVGTSLELFEDHEYKEGRKFKIIGNGRLFNEDAKEALVGAFVADKLGLKVGDSFQPYSRTYLHRGCTAC